jgi:predicted signal transduction protein with EAL and GGDEF domain
MSDTARPKPIGGTIGLIFGSLWCLLGAMALPAALRAPATLAGFAIGAALILLLWRRRTIQGSGTAMFRQRAYIIAVVLEVAAIAAASYLLRSHGLQNFFIPVVGVIVGLHFIGLWQATGMPLFLGIAAAMCVVSVVSMLLPHATGELDMRDAVCGFGNALVLWIGAMWPH